jgi:hypothetical protein
MPASPAHRGGGSGPQQQKQRVSAPPPQKRKTQGESFLARCSCCRSGACLLCVRWRWGGSTVPVRGLPAVRALALPGVAAGAGALSVLSSVVPGSPGGDGAGGGDRLSRVRRVLRVWRRGLLLLGLPPVPLPVSLGAATGAARVVGCRCFSCQLRQHTETAPAPATKATVLRNPLQKKKTQEKPVETRCFCCRASAGAAAALGGPPAAVWLPVLPRCAASRSRPAAVLPRCARSRCCRWRSCEFQGNRQPMKVG